MSDALLGTPIYTGEGTQGAVFFNSTKDAGNSMKWQLFPISASTSYLIRPKATGPNVFIGTQYDPDEETAGNTRPTLFRSDVTDQSIYWVFSSWDDGTYALTNKQNGTDFLLTRLSTGLCAMSAERPSPNAGQHWSILPVENIDDPKYSVVAVRFVLPRFIMMVLILAASRH